MKKSFIFILVLLLILIPITLAQTNTCSNNFSFSNIQDLIVNLNSLNTQLNNCRINLSGAIGSLAGNGNIEISIKLNDGTTTKFYITISNKQLLGVSTQSTGKITYLVSISETTLNSILSSQDQRNSFLSAYNSGQITIKGNNFINKLKLFFARWFIPSNEN